MKKRNAPLWLIPILACSLSEIALASPRKVSYDDLPRLVRERNANVQAAHSSYQAHERRTGYLARSFLPGLHAELGGEDYKAGATPRAWREYWKVGAVLNVFRGGKDALESEKRSLSASAARIDSLGEYTRELRFARQTFWKLVAVNQLLAQRELSLKRNDSNLQASRRRAGAGTATAADSLQFELHATLLRQEQKKLILERDLLRNRLSVALGWDEHESIEVTSDFPHPNEEKPLPPEMDPAKNLEARTLEMKGRAGRTAAAQASRWWAPAVDLYANYGIPSQSDEHALALRRDKEWAAGVRVSLSLGEGIEARNEASAKAYEAAALESRHQHKVREAIAEDHELRHDMKLLHELIHDADKDLEKAEKFLKLTEGEYSRGVKNGPDMLGAFQRYFDFLQKRTELYRDFYEAQASLFALLSKEEE